LGREGGDMGEGKQGGDRGGREGREGTSFSSSLSSSFFFDHRAILLAAFFGVADTEKISSPKNLKKKSQKEEKVANKEYI
jgi:hypothetical protein